MMHMGSKAQQMSQQALNCSWLYGKDCFSTFGAVCGVTTLQFAEGIGKPGGGGGGPDLRAQIGDTQAAATASGRRT